MEDISGSAGTEKGALLQAAVEEAETLGHRVLTASVSPIERGMPLRLISKLLASVAMSEAAADHLARACEGVAPHLRLDEVAGEELTLRRTLTDALVRTSPDRPLVLALTGLENADALSLQLLLLLTSQLPSSALAVVATVLTEAAEAAEALRALIRQPVTEHLRLRPLSASGVRELVRRELGDVAASALADGCSEAAGATAAQGEQAVMRRRCRGHDASRRGWVGAMAHGSVSDSALGLGPPEVRTGRRDQAMTARTSLVRTASPAPTCTHRSVPATSAMTGISIFKDSSRNISRPTQTVSPSRTATRTVATMSTHTSWAMLLTTPATRSRPYGAEPRVGLRW